MKRNTILLNLNITKLEIESTKITSIIYPSTYIHTSLRKKSSATHQAQELDQKHDKLEKKTYLNSPYESPVAGPAATIGKHQIEWRNMRRNENGQNAK